jgi:hypothetical protein
MPSNVIEGQGFMATVDNLLPIKMTSLVPDQSAFNDVLKVGAMPVDVTITITTKGLMSAKKFSKEEMKKHFAPVANEVIAEYEETLAKELEKLAGTVRALAKGGGNGAAEAEKMVAETTLSVNNALASLQGAIDTAINARVKMEAQRDTNLKEARVVTTAKVGKITIAIATSVVKLVATSGANIKSYLDIAKQLKIAYSELRQQLKGEQELAADVTRKLIAVRDATEPGKQRELLAEVEIARKKYRDHLAKYLRQMSSIGNSADALTQAMKQATTLKKGVEIGAQAMAVKRQCTVLQAKYDAGEKKLDEMGTLIVQLGGKVDDRTTIEKLLALDKETIIACVKAAADAASLAKAGEALVTGIVALA